jgi:diguanylate cyclase (GGDEF)-like protein
MVLMATSSGSRSTRFLPPALDRMPDAQANATVARILGAIEEYVYTGEFLEGGGYQVVFAGPCRDRFLGLSVDDARAAIWAQYVHPEDIDAFDHAHASAHATGRLDVEYRIAGADGVTRWVRDRGRVRHEGSRRFLDGSILEVTAVHEARDELEAARARADRLAHTDDLTGVPNRRALPALLAGVDTPLGLLSLDVDRFKQINDLHGHTAGDAVLVEIADRLRGQLRASDRIVRMGGEEFLIMLAGVGDEATLLELAERVRLSVSDASGFVADLPLTLTVSIGATCAPAGWDFAALLATADRHLYAAKRAGRNRVHSASVDHADADAGDDDSDALRIARAMAAAVTAVEGMPEHHLAAVSLMAARIARHLGAAPPLVLRCRLAGLLHDVGNLRLPTALLLKPGPLTPQEWSLVHRHPADGERLVAAVAELAPVAHIVRHHHEHHDGAGYPDGLAGDAIPLEARIVAVADAWDAMTSNRPYRDALSEADALAELDRGSGGQFEATIVAALRAVRSLR